MTRQRKSKRTVKPTVDLIRVMYSPINDPSDIGKWKLFKNNQLKAIEDDKLEKYIERQPKGATVYGLPKMDLTSYYPIMVNQHQHKCTGCGHCH